MQKWIIENNFLATNEEYKGINGIKAFISLDKNIKVKDLREHGLEWKIIEWKDYDSYRELILYTDFLGRVGFPFAIFSKDKKVIFEASSKILVHKNFSLSDCLSILKEKLDYEASSKEIEEIKELIRYQKIFDLNNDLKNFYEIRELIRLLRHQCPWDREQTHKSLVPELIEESLELAEEINKNNSQGMKEELGDVFLQILFQSLLSEEEAIFDFSNVTETLFEKLWERHPHVFGATRIAESKKVLDQWESIKRKKLGDKALNISKILASFLSTVDKQEEARTQGLDFSNTEEIEEKIIEELNEIKESKRTGNNVMEELGDLLFSVINLSRFLHVDPAHALLLSMSKFEKRFEKMKKNSRNLKELSKSKLNEMWEDVKRDE